LKKKNDSFEADFEDDFADLPKKKQKIEIEEKPIEKEREKIKEKEKEKEKEIFENNDMDLVDNDATPPLSPQVKKNNEVDNDATPPLSPVGKKNSNNDKKKQAVDSDSTQPDSFSNSQKKKNKIQIK